MSNKNTVIKAEKYISEKYWLYLEPYTFIFEGEYTDIAGKVLQV
ncbi:MAG: hypothetical protein U9R32_07335 [Bacteroidota bacterium]|nr:hypothetical protein [Bacteroidota bacterium]